MMIGAVQCRISNKHFDRILSPYYSGDWPFLFWIWKGRQVAWPDCWSFLFMYRAVDDRCSAMQNPHPSLWQYFISSILQEGWSFLFGCSTGHIQPRHDQGQGKSRQRKELGVQGCWWWPIPQGLDDWCHTMYNTQQSFWLNFVSSIF